MAGELRMATVQYHHFGTSVTRDMIKLLRVFITVVQRSKWSVVSGACISPWSNTEASQNTVLVGLSTDFALLCFVLAGVLRMKYSGSLWKRILDQVHTLTNTLIDASLPNRSSFPGNCMDCGRSSSRTPFGGM